MEPGSFLLSFAGSIPGVAVLDVPASPGVFVSLSFTGLSVLSGEGSTVLSIVLSTFSFAFFPAFCFARSSIPFICAFEIAVNTRRHAHRNNFFMYLYINCSWPQGIYQ